MKWLEGKNSNSVVKFQLNTLFIEHLLIAAADSTQWKTNSINIERNVSDCTRMKSIQMPHHRQWIHQQKLSLSTTSRCQCKSYAATDAKTWNIFTSFHRWNHNFDVCFNRCKIADNRTISFNGWSVNFYWTVTWMRMKLDSSIQLFYTENSFAKLLK